jgi:hypothetical protein
MVKCSYFSRSEDASEVRKEIDERQVILHDQSGQDGDSQSIYKAQSPSINSYWEKMNNNEDQSSGGHRQHTEVQNVET